MTRLTKKITFPDGTCTYGFSNERIGEFSNNREKGILALFKELNEYEEIGYTAEELKLCFNPPEKLYIKLGKWGAPKAVELYTVRGEEVEFANGDVYWNCRNVLGDYIQVPLDGLHTGYFLTEEEALNFIAKSMDKNN